MFKIYIGNLDKRTTLEHVKNLFTAFPDIDDLVLGEDPETGQSRCFAIAMFKDDARGQLAIDTLQGRRLHGRPLLVTHALKKGKKKDLPPEGGVAPSAENRPTETRRPMSRFGSTSSDRPPSRPFGGDRPSGLGPRGDGGSGERRPGSRPWHRGGGFGGGAGGSSSGSDRPPSTP
ncbi:MAG: RNA-binding protein [Planctomycetota bacterium]|nr:RNA-binding protein [Planctomycetota bacterium]